MVAEKPQSVRPSAALMSAATVSPCPVRGVTATASAACPCPHLRPQFVRGSPGFSSEPTVSRCCTGRRMSAMRPATRLRYFPRESLIARLSPGEASIVTGGSRRATGRNDLDDAQRATQSKGDSRGTGCEPGADVDWTRMVHGHGRLRARLRSWPEHDHGQTCRSGRDQC